MGTCRDEDAVLAPWGDAAMARCAAVGYLGLAAFQVVAASTIVAVALGDAMPVPVAFLATVACCLAVADRFLCLLPPLVRHPEIRPFARVGCLMLATAWLAAGGAGFVLQAPDLLAIAAFTLSVLMVSIAAALR